MLNDELLLPGHEHAARALNRSQSTAMTLPEALTSISRILPLAWRPRIWYASSPLILILRALSNLTPGSAFCAAWLMLAGTSATETTVVSLGGGSLQPLKHNDTSKTHPI